MEPTKFNELVDELLEPALKSHVRQRINFASCEKPRFFHQDSMTLRPRARPCDDCGLTVIGRVIFIEKRAMGTKREHWQKKCGECGKRTPLHNGLKDL